MLHQSILHGRAAVEKPLEEKGRLHLKDTQNMRKMSIWSEETKPGPGTTPDTILGTAHHLAITNPRERHGGGSGGTLPLGEGKGP